MPGPRDEPPPVLPDPTDLDPALAQQEFDLFCGAQTLKGILGHHRRLCAALHLTPGRWEEFYPKLKGCIKSWKAQGLFSKFDKRASHKCYGQGQVCIDSNVLVVGAGPCGLRAAIEAQLLGARVLVIEKRDRLSRNNVLHLWPVVIHDLKALGAKKLFGKFCAGSIDHISIRQLQCILLKVALLLGVEVCENVGYEELLEPPDERTGWRARLSPPQHPAADFQFDVLIGADGKRNTFPCFRRKEFRGKLAIAITANFVNSHSEWEAKVDEISGVAFIFKQKFFKDLSAATGIELENIVYYKDDTHYFVMTAKKQSLIAKGVILEDRPDTASLLSPENISRERLMAYAREAASFSTDAGLEPLRFARNHYGLEDVAMFDFTSMFAACHASAVRHRKGHSLLLQLVGDSLLEPFWPTGSGCARGFLSCWDAAWQLRGWCDLRSPPVQCMAERESVYRLLAQTTPENLSGDLSAYTIDPRTRYPNLNTEVVLPVQVRALVDTDDPAHLAAQLAEAAHRRSLSEPTLKRPYQPLPTHRLLLWLRRRLPRDVDQLTDLSPCLRSGGVLSQLLTSYRPELAATLETDPGLERMLQLVKHELGVPAPPLSEDESDSQLAATYLSQVWDALHGLPPPTRPRLQDAGGDVSGPWWHTPERRAAPDGGGLDNDTLRRQRKRKSEPLKLNRHTPQAKRPVVSALSSKEQFDSKVKDLEAKFSGTYQPPSDQLPKPASRVIGRIDKSDWNVQQIERKIEENSRRRHHQERPAQLSELPVIRPDGAGFQVGRRGHNRVAEMAERFQARAGDGNGPVARPTVAPSQPTVACHFCGQHGTVSQMAVVEGRHCHASCLRCEFCGIRLTAANQAFDTDSARFFCLPHLGLHSLVKYKYQRAEKPPEDFSIGETLQVRSMEVRGRTPERVEYENSVAELSEEEEPDEMDHETWSDVDSEAYSSDSDSSTLSEYNASNEFSSALGEAEVLRLAERWQKLHGEYEENDASSARHSERSILTSDEYATATQSDEDGGSESSVPGQRGMETRSADNDRLWTYSNAGALSSTSEASSDLASSDASSSESPEDEAITSEYEGASVPVIVLQASPLCSPRLRCRPEPIGAEGGSESEPIGVDNGSDSRQMEAEDSPLIRSERSSGEKSILQNQEKHVMKDCNVRIRNTRHYRGRPSLPSQRLLTDRAAALRRTRTEHDMLAVAVPSREGIEEHPEVYKAADHISVKEKQASIRPSSLDIRRSSAEFSAPNRTSRPPTLVARDVTWRAPLQIKRQEMISPSSPGQSPTSPGVSSPTRGFMERVTEKQRILASPVSSLSRLDPTPARVLIAASAGRGRSPPVASGRNTRAVRKPPLPAAAVVRRRPVPAVTATPVTRPGQAAEGQAKSSRWLESRDLPDDYFGSVVPDAVTVEDQDRKVGSDTRERREKSSSEAHSSPDASPVRRKPLGDEYDDSEPTTYRARRMSKSDSESVNGDVSETSSHDDYDTYSEREDATPKKRLSRSRSASLDPDYRIEQRSPKAERSDDVGTRFSKGSPSPLQTPSGEDSLDDNNSPQVSPVMGSVCRIQEIDEIGNVERKNQRRSEIEFRDRNSTDSETNYSSLHAYSDDDNADKLNVQQTSHPESCEALSVSTAMNHPLQPGFHHRRYTRAQLSGSEVEDGAIRVQARATEEEEVPRSSPGAVCTISDAEGVSSGSDTDLQSLSSLTKREMTSPSPEPSADDESQTFHTHRSLGMDTRPEDGTIPTNAGLVSTSNGGIHDETCDFDAMLNGADFAELERCFDDLYDRSSSEEFDDQLFEGTSHREKQRSTAICRKYTDSMGRSVSKKVKAKASKQKSDPENPSVVEDEKSVSSRLDFRQRREDKTGEEQRDAFMETANNQDKSSLGYGPVEYAVSPPNVPQYALNKNMPEPRSNSYSVPKPEESHFDEHGVSVPCLPVLASNSGLPDLVEHLGPPVTINEVIGANSDVKEESGSKAELDAGKSSGADEAVDTDVPAHDDNPHAFSSPEETDLAPASSVAPVTPSGVYPCAEKTSNDEAPPVSSMIDIQSSTYKHNTNANSLSKGTRQKSSLGRSFSAFLATLFASSTPSETTETPSNSSALEATTSVPSISTDGCTNHLPATKSISPISLPPPSTLPAPPVGAAQTWLPNNPPHRPLSTTGGDPPPPSEASECANVPVKQADEPQMGRTATAAAGLPRAVLSRQPQPLTAWPQEEVPPPAEASLVRDLVLSRVHKSPEKQLKKRSTAPHLDSRTDQEGTEHSKLKTTADVLVPRSSYLHETTLPVSYLDESPSTSSKPPPLPVSPPPAISKSESSAISMFPLSSIPISQPTLISMSEPPSTPMAQTPCASKSPSSSTLKSPTSNIAMSGPPSDLIPESPPPSAFQPLSFPPSPTDSNGIPKKTQDISSPAKTSGNVAAERAGPGRGATPGVKFSPQRENTGPEPSAETRRASVDGAAGCSNPAPEPSWFFTLPKKTKGKYKSKQNQSLRKDQETGEAPKVADTSEWPTCPDREETPPPLPQKTRLSRFSRLQGSARALFSPPRRPPRSSRSQTSPAGQPAVYSREQPASGLSTAGTADEEHLSATRTADIQQLPATRTADIKQPTAATLSEPQSETAEKTITPKEIMAGEYVDLADANRSSSELMEDTVVLSVTQPTNVAADQTPPDLQVSAPLLVELESSPENQAAGPEQEVPHMKKRRERRRSSILQAISDIFRSTDKLKLKSPEKGKPDGNCTSSPAGKEATPLNIEAPATLFERNENNSTKLVKKDSKPSNSDKKNNSRSAIKKHKKQVCSAPNSAEKPSGTVSDASVNSGQGQQTVTMAPQSPSSTPRAQSKRSRFSMRFRKTLTDDNITRGLSDTPVADKDVAVAANTPAGDEGMSLDKEAPHLRQLTETDQSQLTKTEQSQLEETDQSQLSEPEYLEGTLARKSHTSRHHNAEMRRLHRAQEVQRQLEEMEVRYQQLETRGVQLERAIRGQDAADVIDGQLPTATHGVNGATDGDR